MTDHSPPPLGTYKNGTSSNRRRAQTPPPPLAGMTMEQVVEAPFLEDESEIVVPADYDGDDEVKPTRRIPRRKKSGDMMRPKIARSRSRTKRGGSVNSGSGSGAKGGNNSWNGSYNGRSLNASGSSELYRDILAAVSKEKNAVVNTSEAEALPSLSAAFGSPVPVRPAKTAAATVKDTPSSPTNTTTAKVPATPLEPPSSPNTITTTTPNTTVKVKAIVRNFRLSRSLSRVLHGSRSLSPCRKKSLADEIAKEAARREAKGRSKLPPPPPPPLEQTPLLLMRFTQKATPRLIKLVEHRLIKSGLIVYDKVQGTEEMENYTYLYLTAAQEALETFAEQVRWMKRTNDTHVVEYFTVQQRRKFLTKPQHMKKRGPGGRLIHHQTTQQQSLEESTRTGGDDLFTSNEWCHMAFRLLDSVEVWLSGASSSELNLMLMLKDENFIPTVTDMDSSMNDSSSTARTRMAMMKKGSRPSFRRSNSSDGASFSSLPTVTEQPPPPAPPATSPRIPRHIRRTNTSMGETRSMNVSFSDATAGAARPTLRRTASGDGSDRNMMPHRRTFRKTPSMGDKTTGTGMDSSTTQSLNRRLNFQRQKSIMLQRVQKAGKRSSCLRHVLEANEFVDVVTPLHWGPARDAIVAETWKPDQLTPPVNEIRNYWGEDVAFYFAWMGYYSSWLVVLGAMGCVTVLFRWFRGDNVDEDEFTPMYGIFAFIWGVLFLRFWERHEHRLAYRWGTYSLSAYDKQKFLTTRPEFRGKLRISPVTGDYETYYPAHKRRMQYCLSTFVTIIMLCVAFWMMILSLNMQGYIHPERNPERWHPHNPHPFHFPSFAVLSERDALFDAKHAWRSFIPTFIHVAMIFTLNSFYRIIATFLTNLENHETEAVYRNSLIVKRFLFEAFDCYVALFYLAFYERDVVRLQMELATVFNIDTFRRLTMECFIPILVQKFTKWSHHQTDIVKKSIKRQTSRRKGATSESKNTKNDKNDTKGSPSSVGTASTAAMSEAEVEATAPENDETNTNGDSKTPSSNHNNAGTAVEEDLDASLASFSSQKDSPSPLSPHGTRSNPTLEQLAEEADKDEYEAFDDYMEIVIQFGYVTLFASAYPLASVVALAANWVEIRSDCFKLARVCRRPQSLRAEGIGVWKQLLSCVVWMSALTNCLIVGFTSDQMKEIFPMFYAVDQHGDTHLVHDKGWIAVFVIFGLERVLILIGLMIFLIIPGVPEDVEDEIERLHYIRHQEHEEVMRKVMRNRNHKKKS